VGIHDSDGSPARSHLFRIERRHLGGHAATQRYEHAKHVAGRAHDAEAIQVDGHVKRRRRIFHRECTSFSAHDGAELEQLTADRKAGQKRQPVQRNGIPTVHLRSQLSFCVSKLLSRALVLSLEKQRAENEQPVVGAFTNVCCA
jgi:hypothetical protein